MSLTGAAAGVALDRSHLVRGRGSAAASPGRASRRRSRGHGRLLSLLVALALGAGVALWLLHTAFPGAARGDGEPGGTAAPAAPAAVEIVAPATVVATSSCVGEDPRDTIALDGPGGRRLLPLDACGSPLGSRITVRAAFVGTEPAEAPARVLGTGSAAALDATEPAESPLTDRLAILLTGVAGLGMAGLLVAVVRERSRRTAAPQSARPVRPARTTTTTGGAARVRRPGCRAPSRVASRPIGEGRTSRRARRRPSPVHGARRDAPPGDDERRGSLAGPWSGRRAAPPGRRSAPPLGWTM